MKPFEGIVFSITSPNKQLFAATFNQEIMFETWMSSLVHRMCAIKSCKLQMSTPVKPASEKFLGNYLFEHTYQIYNSYYFNFLS